MAEKFFCYKQINLVQEVTTVYSKKQRDNPLNGLPRRSRKYSAYKLSGSRSKTLMHEVFLLMVNGEE